MCPVLWDSHTHRNGLTSSSPGDVGAGRECKRAARTSGRAWLQTHGYRQLTEKHKPQQKWHKAQASDGKLGGKRAKNQFCFLINALLENTQHCWQKQRSWGSSSGCHPLPLWTAGNVIHSTNPACKEHPALYKATETGNKNREWRNSNGQSSKPGNYHPLNIIKLSWNYNSNWKNGGMHFLKTQYTKLSG